MKPFRFRGDLENDTWFRTLRVDGVGLYGEKLFDTEVKGKIEVTGIGLGKLSPWIDGIAETKGDFLHGGKGLSVKGPFAIDGFQLKGRPLKVPFYVARGSGNCAITFHNGMLGLRLTEAHYEGSPLTIDLKVKDDKLHNLDIMSGPLSVADIKNHFSMPGNEGGDLSYDP